MAPWGRRKQLRADDSSTKVDEVKGNGLEVLYEPEHIGWSSEEILNVIFVSGLNSIGIKPWSHDSGIVWPVDLLPKDLPNVRILLWSHSTTINSTSRILDCARGLLSDIRAFGRDDADLQPMAFVAQSGGGNIVKEALSIACGSPYEQTVHQTIGILFLSTPHHCPEHLRNVGRIAQLYRACGFHLNPMFRELMNPKYLDDQNQKFAARVVQYSAGLKIYSFYENQGTGFPLMKKRSIVDDVAATIGYPDEEVMPLEATHNLMGKYPGRNDANYTRVLHCLKSVARIAPSRSFPTVKSSDTNISNGVNQEADLQLVGNESPSLTAGLMQNKSYDTGLNPNMDHFEDRITASGLGINPNEAEIAISKGHNESSSRNPANEKVGSINQTQGQLHGLRGAILASNDKHNLSDNGSSASNGGIAASTRPTSLSSENMKPNPEHLLAATSQTNGLSMGPQLPPSLTSSPDPTMSDSIPASSNPVSSDYLMKGSQAVFRAAREASGLTVAEKTAIANACLAGTGLVVAAANPLIAGKSLSVAKENLEQAKISARAATRSAMAGTRAAHYAKKSSQSQRHAAKNGSPDDSKDSSDSSDSSRGFRRTTTRRHKGRANPKEHSVYRTDIQRLEDLPKPPEDIYERAKRQTFFSAPQVDRVAAQDRPVQAMAYDSFGQALNVDVDETYEGHIQNAAMTEYSNEHDPPANQPYRNADNDAMLPFTSAGFDELHHAAKIDAQVPKTQETIPQEPIPREPIPQVPIPQKSIPQASNLDDPQQPRVEGTALTTEHREAADDTTATKPDPDIPAQSPEYAGNSPPTSNSGELIAPTSASSLSDSPASGGGTEAVERDAITGPSNVGRSSVRQGVDVIPGTDDGDGGFEMDVIHGGEQPSKPDAVVSNSNS